MLEEKVTNTQVENEQKNKKSKGIAKRLSFSLGCVVIYILIVGIVFTAMKLPGAIDKMIENSKIEKAKVVLYEGPKSLKDSTSEDIARESEKDRNYALTHCVDTKVYVNGQESYMYDTNVNNTHTWMTNYLPLQDRTPITYFDFDGMVEITVEVPETDIDCVTIRPLSYNIKPDIDVKNHTVTFRIEKPDTYTVEFNNNVQRAVHIFANPLETDVPDFEDEDVLYIGPGEWDIENIVLEDYQTLYISGGAVVHGTINANFVEGVKVCGRGIIDGSTFTGWQGRNAKVPLKFDNCQDIELSGIIALNSNAWCLQSYNTIGGEIDNVKIITSRPNGDGISLQSCNNFTVKNSFVRSWDDSLVVKNYDVNSADIAFKNIQIWTDLAQSMEIGYETNKGNKENSTIKRISFEDITVLHNFHKPVLSIHNADNAAVSDITYKNIVVEEACMGKGDGTKELIAIQVVNNSNWSTTLDRGTISNVTIDGLKVLYGNEDFMPSIIKGYDSEHGVSDVTMTNINFFGQDIKSLEEKYFVVDDSTTSDIVIK